MSGPPIATQAAAAEPDDVTYSFKPSLMATPREFRVGAEALDWRVGRHEGRLPYHAIKAVRLSFRPMTLQSQRYLTEIWSEHTPKLTVASTSTRGLVDLSRQDEAYAAFVRALHQRLSASRAGPRLLAGLSPYAFWPGLALSALLLPAVIVMLVRSLQAGAVGGAAAMGAIVLFFLYQLAVFLWRNRPARYALERLPARLLPGG